MPKELFLESYIIRWELIFVTFDLNVVLLSVHSGVFT